MFGVPTKHFSWFPTHLFNPCKGSCKVSNSLFFLMRKIRFWSGPAESGIKQVEDLKFTQVSLSPMSNPFQNIAWAPYKACSVFFQNTEQGLAPLHRQVGLRESSWSAERNQGELRGSPHGRQHLDLGAFWDHIQPDSPLPGMGFVFYHVYWDTVDTINWAYLYCTIWWVLTYVYMPESNITHRRVNAPCPPQAPLGTLQCSSPVLPPLPLASNYWSAVGHYTLLCTFWNRVYKWTLTVCTPFWRGWERGHGFSHTAKLCGETSCCFVYRSFISFYFQVYSMNIWIYDYISQYIWI